MNKNTVDFVIDGPNVSPESVDVADLAEALTLVKRILGVNEEETPTADQQDILALVSIKSNCDRLTLTVPPSARSAIERADDAIRDEQLSRLDKGPIKAIREMWVLMRKKGWEHCRFDIEGTPFARIDADKLFFQKPLNYRGTTSIYGECIRVGGEKKPTALVRLLNEKTLAVRLRSTEEAQHLGRRLFQSIGLVGEAEFDGESHEMVGFEVDRITDFGRHQDEGRETGSIFDALNALREASGGRWEDVDPDDFLRSLRADDT